MAKRSKKSGAALFDQPVRRLVWTNRANVLAMCAAGVIWPSKQYHKHYPDVSDLTPGRVPVFSDKIPVRLGDAVNTDSDLFDVAIEIDSGAIRDAETVDESGWSVALAGRPIPWAAVRKVYVRSKDDAEDLRAREFGDLPPDPWVVEVSPQIWDAESPVAGLVERLTGVAPGAAESLPMTEADRFAGGIALMRRVLPKTLACELGIARLCSGNIRTRQLPKLMPEVPGWLQQLAKFTQAETAPEGIDEHLFQAALVVIGRLHVESGSDSREIAGAIADEAVRVAGTKVDAEARKWATYAKRVADGDITPSSLEDSGSHVRRALLLFLLRTEPARMAKAGQSTLRPGTAVHSLAAFLSGFGAGYSRLERDIKGDVESHRAISLLIVNRLRKLAFPEEREEEVQLQLVPSEDEPPGTVRVRTTISGLLLWDRRTEPADDMKKLYFQAKTAGVELVFDSVWSRFTARVDIGEDAPHTVFIESGMGSRHNQPSVRFSSDCPLPGGRSAKTLSKAELLSLLERNADLDMQCRFGVSRTDGTLQVVAHQLVETLDVPELKAHLDAVARTAAEVTARMAARPPQEPQQPE